MKSKVKKGSSKVLLRKISGWMMTSGGGLTMLISLVSTVLLVILLRMLVQEVPDTEDTTVTSEAVLWLGASIFMVIIGLVLSSLTFLGSIIVTITGILVIKGRMIGLVLTVMIIGSSLSLLGMNYFMAYILMNQETDLLLPLFIMTTFTFLWGFFLFSVLWSFDSFGKKKHKHNLVSRVNHRLNKTGSG